MYYGWPRGARVAGLSREYRGREVVRVVVLIMPTVPERELLARPPLDTLIIRSPDLLTLSLPTTSAI